jgi:hypothetical protein
MFFVMINFMKKRSSVTFLNGYSPRKNSLGLLAFPDALSSETRFCRFFSMTTSGEWFHLDFDFDCRSLAAILATKTWFILGKNGEIIEIGVGGNTKITQIFGAGLYTPEKRGYLETIKNINDQLFVCGYGRQVYQKINEQWVSIAEDILTKKTGTGFFDIDGTSAFDIYGVGWNGEIYYYNGLVWEKENSPTKEHLASVKCLNKNEIWICGNNGIVLFGSRNNWKAIHDKNYQNNWYSIEEFNNRIYIAGNNILAYIDGENIKPVETGLNKKFTTHKLHAKDGLLWSIGEKDILTYDGKSWEELLHPDN